MRSSRSRRSSTLLLKGSYGNQERIRVSICSDHKDERGKHVTGKFTTKLLAPAYMERRRKKNLGQANFSHSVAASSIR